jgi:hypothetical protein
MHHGVMMRATLSIDQDLYEIALAIARDRRQSLSAVVNQLLRNGLTTTPEEPPRTSKTAFPSFRTRRKVTLEDVRALEDEM